MIKFDIKYPAAIKRYIKDLPEKFEEGTLEGLRKAMFAAEGFSKKVFAESGPVRKPPGPLVARTGHLRRSIKGEVESARIGILYSKVAYARPHELGISPMPARPFLRPALEGDNLDKIREIIKDSIFKEMK